MMVSQIFTGLAFYCSPGLTRRAEGGMSPLGMAMCALRDMVGFEI